MTGADDNYDPRAIQDKWQARWDELNPFAASEDPADERPRRYALDMFPYPSGDLHMGHAEAFAIGDVVARYWFQQGYNVLHPIGWDSFGLPAENAAIKRDAHPAEWTYANIETQAESFRRYAISFDWSRRLHTSDPEYYRWTQWLFLRFYERGLAYRKAATVNWCPNDQTVLANEQVVAGHCERCGTRSSEKTLLTQWYFKITDYAERLLDDMAQLEGSWPERVLLMQRNWIGRSDGRRRRLRRSRAATSRSPSTRPGPTRCTARRSSWSPPTPRWPTRSARPSSGRSSRRTATTVQRASEIERLSTDRDEDRRLPGPVRDQPGQRRADARVRRRLRAGRLRHRRDHGRARARPARPGLRARLRPAGPRRRAHRRGRPGRVTGVATAGDGELVNSGPLRRPDQGRRRSRAITDDAGGARAWARPRSTTGCATG